MEFSVLSLLKAATQAQSAEPLVKKVITIFVLKISILKMVGH
jgi:hypothetical protein